MRAPTLAVHASAMAVMSDQVISAVHSRDVERIERTIAQAQELLPPHGFEPLVSLIVTLAAQVDRTVPLVDRLAWVVPEPHLEVVA